MEAFYFPGRRDVVAVITRTSDGKLNETVLWRMSNPGPLCYDVQHRNVYVVEEFKKATKTLLRSIAGSWNQNHTENLDQWSTIMVSISWAESD